MARRHLSLTPAEWDALAWWEQKMYFEGFVWEGLLEVVEADSDSTVVAQEVHQSGGTTITDRTHRATFSGEPGEMEAFGIRERTI